eukprot:Rmarinus@m.29480
MSSPDNREQKLTEVLKKHFGYDKLYPQQLRAVDAILHGKDALVVAATGSGKSLCYQLPPLAKNGTAIVVSPLLSLMEDQVLDLSACNIKATFISSHQHDMSVLTDAMNGKYALVYMTPEKISNWKHGLEKLYKTHGIVCFAIDEAHCVSEWGHNFRPDYLQLSCLREWFPDVPVVAVTATATQQVRREIVASLKMKGDLEWCVSTFKRPNLFVGVKKKSGDGTMADLAPELRRFHPSGSTIGSAVIYCRTQSDTDTVAKVLLNEGYRVGCYHAGLSEYMRKKVHHDFMQDAVNVVVATVAFGMGINKPDIRLVVHYGLCKTLEEYYQQIGRAGRDGGKARCVMFYAQSDFSKVENLIAHDRRQTMERELFRRFSEYLQWTECRHRFINRYFGEDVDSSCGCMCDNCASGSTAEDVEVGKEVWLFLRAMTAARGYGITTVYHVLMGKSSANVKRHNMERSPVFGQGKSEGIAYWKALYQMIRSQMEHVIEDKPIQQAAGTKQSWARAVPILGTRAARYLAPSSEDRCVPVRLRASIDLINIRKEKESKLTKRASFGSAATDPAESAVSEAARAELEHQRLKSELIAVRSKVAVAHGIRPYAVFAEEVLDRMCVLKPTDYEALLGISGVSEAKAKSFGSEFLQAIQQFEASKAAPLAPLECPAKWKGLIIEFDPPKITPTVETSVDLYCKGKSLAEIAAERNVQPSTIAGHLCTAYTRNFGNLDYTRLAKDVGLGPYLEDIIEKVILDVRDVSRLTPIIEKCPTGTTYPQVKVVLARILSEVAGHRPPSSLASPAATASEARASGAGSPGLDSLAAGPPPSAPQAPLAPAPPEPSKPSAPCVTIKPYTREFVSRSLKEKNWASRVLVLGETDSEIVSGAGSDAPVFLAYSKETDMGYISEAGDATIRLEGASTSLRRVAQVCVSSGTVAVVLEDGVLCTWGATNAQGQLGQGDKKPRRAPTPVAELSSKVVQTIGASVGSLHAAAFSNTGKLFSWGRSDTGALGYTVPTSLPVLTPRPISISNHIVQVSCGLNHTVAVGSDGMAYGWGDSRCGQIGTRRPKIMTPMPIYLPTSDGTTKMSGSSGGYVERCVAGKSHTLLLVRQQSESGTNWKQVVMATGKNVCGQLGLGHQRDQFTFMPVDCAFDSHLVVSMSAGRAHSGVCTAAGHLWLWGSDSASVIDDDVSTNDASAAILNSSGERCFVRPVRVQRVRGCCELACGEDGSTAIIEARVTGTNEPWTTVADTLGASLKAAEGVREAALSPKDAAPKEVAQKAAAMSTPADHPRGSSLTGPTHDCSALSQSLAPSDDSGLPVPKRRRLLPGSLGGGYGLATPSNGPVPSSKQTRSPNLTPPQQHQHQQLRATASAANRVAIPTAAAAGEEEADSLGLDTVDWDALVENVTPMKPHVANGNAAGPKCGVAVEGNFARDARDGQG